MGWATFWAFFSQTHLVALMHANQSQTHVTETCLEKDDDIFYFWIRKKRQNNFLWK
jgi:hypothetical protein